MTQVENRVNDILTTLGIPMSAITAEAHFTRDLGMDSLDQAELVLNLEQAFGVAIPDGDWPQLSTVGEAIGYLEQRLQLSSTPAY